MDSIGAQRIRRLRERARVDPAFRPKAAFTLSDLASDLSALGLHDEAVAAGQSAVEAFETYAPTDEVQRATGFAFLFDQLGVIYRDAGDVAGSRASSRRAVDTLDASRADDPVALDVLATALVNLAVDLEDGEESEEIEVLRRAVSLYERLDARQYSYDLADALERLGRTLLSAGQTAEAVSVLDRSLDLYADTVSGNSEVLNDLDGAASTLMKAHRRRGDSFSALRTARQTADRFGVRALTDEAALVLQGRWLRETARAADAMADVEAVRTAAQAALATSEALAARHEDSCEDLARSLALFATMSASLLHRPKEGVEMARRAVRIWEERGASAGDSNGLADALMDLSFVEGEAGNSPAALAASERALKLVEGSSDPWACARALDRRGLALEREGDSEMARSCWREALERLREVEGAFASHANFRARLATNLASAMSKGGQTDEGLAYAQWAVKTREGLGSADADAVRFLPSSLLALSEALLTSGQVSEALPQAARAATILRARVRDGVAHDQPSLFEALEQLASCLEAGGETTSASAVRAEAERVSAHAIR